MLKWIGNRNKNEATSGEDILVVGAINYIVAAILSVPLFINAPFESVSNGAVWTGASMGAIYIVGYVLVIRCIQSVGVTATTVVSVLSLLIPITFAALFWKEQPTTAQSIGVALALAALMLVGGKKSGEQVERAWFTPLILASFFLVCGGSRLSQHAFKYLSTPDQTPTFLLSAFVISSIPSAALLVYVQFTQKRSILKSEWVFGIGLGVTNILQSHFILKCLESYPGYIVFPATSAGSVLLTTAVATCLLSEKLTSRTYVGVGIAVVALFLLNYS